MSHAINRVRKFLSDLREPYTLIRSSFDSTSCTAFATCLTKPAESFSTWMNFDALKRMELFSWDPPTKLSIPFDGLSDKIKQVLTDAQHIKDIGTWVFAISVTFPQLLGKEEMKRLLKLTIADRHYDILFRDEIIDFKQEINKAIKNYTNELKERINVNKCHNQNNMVLNAQINELYAIGKLLRANDGIKDLEQRHLDTQTWLTLGVRDLIYTFSEVPGAIAPKLQIVFGILHKIKHEILWSVVHCSKCKNNDSSAVNQFWRKFCHFPELLHNSYKLSSMVLKYRVLIYEYYAEVLEMSLIDLNREFEKLEATQALDGSVRGLVKDIMKKLNEYQKIKDAEKKQYSHIRLDCYRIQCYISMIGLHSKHKKECDVFMRQLKKLCDESRFAESIETELKHCNPFKTLWFYPRSLQGLFDVILDINTVKTTEELQAMKYGVTASHNIARYWNIYIRICEYAIQNVHHEYGDEQYNLGTTSVEYCEKYIIKAGEMIKKCLNVILDRKYKLNRQIGTETIAPYLLRMAQDPYYKMPYYAGQESFQSKNGYSRSLSQLNEHMSLLIDMVHGFSEINSVIIFNQTIYPNAYLHDIVKSWFKHKLKSMFAHKNRNIPTRDRKRSVQGFLVPTKLFSFLNQTFAALSALDMVLHLDMEIIVNKILFEEFFIPTFDPTQLKDNILKGFEDKLIRNVCDYYITLIEHTYIDGNSYYNNLPAIYSPYTLSWISSDSYDVIGQALQDFCSETELVALCSIIGVHGARILDYEILKEISHSIFVLISTISNNQNNTKIFDKVCHSGIHDIKDLHYLMTNKDAIRLLNLFNLHGLRIGAFVQFRKLLKQALNKVCDQGAPFKKQTVEIIQKSMNIRDTDCEEKDDELTQALNKMMRSFAINDEGTMILQSIKEKFQTNNNDKNEFINNIPMFMSVAFLSQEFWNKNNYGTFDINIGNFRNNGIALSECVEFLFKTFYNTTNDKLIREQKLFWLNTSIYCVTELINCTKNNNPINENAISFIKYHSGTELLMFFTAFIEINNQHLNESDLDSEFNVYDLIRSETVRICGASSTYTTSKLYVDPSDDEKSNENNGGQIRRKSSSLLNIK